MLTQTSISQRSGEGSLLWKGCTRNEVESGAVGKVSHRTSPPKHVPLPKQGVPLALTASAVNPGYFERGIGIG